MKATLSNVPSSDVDRVSKEFKDEGATSVEVNKQPDGDFTIVATFPDPTDTAVLPAAKAAAKIAGHAAIGSKR